MEGRAGEVHNGAESGPTYPPQTEVRPMSDSTQNPQATDTTTPDAQATEEQVKTYSTKEECEANKPTNVGKKKPFGVTKDGVTRWLWAAGYVNAMDAIARLDG